MRLSASEMCIQGRKNESIRQSNTHTRVAFVCVCMTQRHMCDFVYACMTQYENLFKAQSMSAD